jgi:hypothetical protein
MKKLVSSAADTVEEKHFTNSDLSFADHVGVS